MYVEYLDKCPCHELSGLGYESPAEVTAKKQTDWTAFYLYSSIFDFEKNTTVKPQISFSQDDWLSRGRRVGWYLEAIPQWQTENVLLSQYSSGKGRLQHRNLQRFLP